MPFFSQFISDLRNRASSNPASVVRLSPSLRHILLIPSRIDALIQPEQSLLRESQVANDSVQVQNAQEGVPNANENSCYENLDKKIQGANELSPDNIKNGSDQNQDIQDASNQSQNTEVNEGNECGNNLILHQDIRYTSTSNPNQERQDTRVNDANENGNGQSLNQDIQNASSSNPDQEVNADNENRSGQNLNRDIQYASSNPDQEVNAGNVNSINQNQYQEAQEANKNGNDANPENNDDKNDP
ncbi:myb-like protein I isoform X1 [Drosophila ficusphila]|uniref:myb-like protein I isoform X1 n=1 Tax=Drosophila ficusphila TaxID=30025 RepID=UPI001C88F0A9|nr:myb-like protein I isoform X1 [Drosophila ficusphila]